MVIIWKDKTQVTKEDIIENLKRVDKGKELTMPLTVLNGEFKREYNKKYNACIDIAEFKPRTKHQPKEPVTKICIICGDEFNTKDYNQLMCRKKECKEERRRFNRKRYYKIYNQRSEVKAKNKKYAKKYYKNIYYPKHKKKILAHQKECYQKRKLKKS